jgi:hypothetical protein
LSGHVLGRLRRPVRATSAVIAAVAVTLSLSLTGQAIARGSHEHPKPVPPPPAQPTSDNQIQNIDQVKTAIKAYYGDTVTNTDDPVDNSIDGATVKLHTFNPDGAYAHQMGRIAADAKRYLADDHDRRGHGGTTGTKAILLDVDDTSLNTYDYEIYSNFVYNPTTNAAFVNACLTSACVFPAVPHMPDLVSFAKAHGYKVFFLTGRPEAQRAGTVANLADAGYGTVADDHLYLKDLTKPWLSSCAPSCTTIQYKSLTRQHIESLGYDIVANFGDQYSDLTGGFADRTFKLPNPMYYLP